MKKNRFLTHSALIAAVYAALCYLQNFLVPNSASWVIQFRAAEALCVLALFTPAAIPGLFIGCFVSNLIAGGVIWDVVFGSIATLLGALGANLLKNKSIYLAPVPTVAANMVIVPFVLRYAYGAEGSLPFFALTVGFGEFVTAGILGVFLAKTLKKHKIMF